MMQSPDPSTSSSSGISSYQPISNLERQNVSPVGSRLHLFVKLNPNCCLIGGVEALLKQKQAMDTTCSTSATTTSASTSGSATKTTTTTTGDDPFSFLTSNGSTGGVPPPPPTSPVPPPSAPAPTTSTRKSKQVGKFFSGMAKKAQANLEKGITNLAIKADKGKNPDVLSVGLYDATGIHLLSLTEASPLPITDFERLKGIPFRIPLTIPPSLVMDSNTDTVVTIKLWIQSGAAFLKQRQYLLGQAHVTMLTLKNETMNRPMASLTLPLTEPTVVVDGQFQLLVCRDLKFPPLHGRGWSLTDPDASGYTQDGLFHLPLDQSYGFLSTKTSAGYWWVATERATESNVVLPVATAVAKLAEAASRQSLLHATHVSQQLLMNRHDSNASTSDTSGNDIKATVNIKVGYLWVQSSHTATTGAAQLSMSWQRPDSIFEVELAPPTKVPVNTVQVPFSPTMKETIFWPKVATTDILPAILQQYTTNGTKAPPAFLLGNVRFAITLSKASGSGGDPFATVGTAAPSPSLTDDETWQVTLPMESYLNSTASAEPIQLPVYHTQTGAVMGNLVLQVSVVLPPPAPTPPTASTAPTASSGLVSVMGLDTLMEPMGTLPLLDFDTVAVPADPQLVRRQQQLKTMGNFISHQYLQNHVTTIISLATQTLHGRVDDYTKALAFNPQVDGHNMPPHKDKTPKPFRPSASRTTAALAGIPFNVHAVTLAMEQGPTTSTSSVEGGYFPNVTCGAPADHARGFGPLFANGPSGGLRRLESRRLEWQQQLGEAHAGLIQAVASFFVTARNHNQTFYHISARNPQIANLRWKVFELTQQLHQITWTCAERRAACFSQALGIALTSYLTSIGSKVDDNRATMWVQHGYLITYEGLLSAAGKELGMIEDASVGIAMLRMVTIMLVSDETPAPADKVDLVHAPHLKWMHLSASGVGSATQYVLRVAVDAQYHAMQLSQPLRNGAPVRFYPLLYQVGVDIHQAAANTHLNLKGQLNQSVHTTNISISPMKAEADKTISAVLEDDDDDDGMADTDVLVQLNYEALRKMNSYAHAISHVDQLPGQPPQVHPILTSLNSHIMGSAGKMNHGILDEAASVAQKLGGGGVVFCKSGKDRTAMHITYKQAQFIHRYLNTINGPSTVYDDATKMRVYGTRLPICEKNIGLAKYAFNTLQVRFMPEMLKPPVSTLAGFLKGGAVFTKGGGIES